MRAFEPQRVNLLAEARQELALREVIRRWRAEKRDQAVAALEPPSPCLAARLPWHQGEVRPSAAWAHYRMKKLLHARETRPDEQQGVRPRNCLHEPGEVPIRSQPFLEL